MINNGLNNHSSLATKQVLPVDNANHTLSSKLQHSPLEIAPKLIPELATELSPKITSDFLSQFSDEKVAQLLQQQLSVLITPAKKANISSYHYSAEELAIRTVITSQQEGLLKNEHSDKLIQRLNKSVTDIQGAYANTSDILFNLGQLGHQQTSFLASSQQRVERALNPYMESINRSKHEDDDNYRFQLSVKTKEGDTINITFNSSQGYDESAGKTADNFSLSYEVEGDLSEAEHQALTEVLAGVGEMADEFFKVSQYANSRYVPVNQGDINLDFLADFNHQQLSGFNVSFSTTQNDVLDIGENTLDLSYSIDEASNQQALVFKSESGQNEIDFALDMSTIGAKDTQQVQRYLASLDQSLEDSRVNSTKDDKESAFGRKGDEAMQQGFALFKGAFTSMSSAAERYSNLESLADQHFNDGRAMVADLVDNMITNDARYQGLGNKAPNTLGAGISKLADFDATFSYALDNGDYQPKSTIELSQATEQAQLGDLSGVTQSKNVSSHFDYQYSRPDYYNKEESYNVGTAVKNKELVGLDQSHEVDVDTKMFEFNPQTNQYELQMAMQEQTISKSNIRLIDDIWLEENENSYNMNKKERVESDEKQDEFKKTSSHSHNKLVTLICDLDKLAENKNVRREYLTNLSQVNFFMDKK
ncbi:hypothetical protein PNIG_b0191 [Pseudoalteromonas nigrifaciens]|uniref:Uncharacterized protein n=1 Tax=Pseudoalteromonas nigrifaciens TaxID=28109 RepID=A0AAC9ULD4_9GAMM|nr:hypothetical protein [Pseudoalteromonas nigrifaciens]ASM55828.1 hypothetical protein PNIG_b0191 [Pseudoalteromonas nigrifaciens]GEN42914.1 hypothetical protein PNI02_23800 [Pseudoalteromonas nigrifaciens]